MDNFIFDLLKCSFELEISNPLIFKDDEIHITLGNGVKVKIFTKTLNKS